MNRNNEYLHEAPVNRRFRLPHGHGVAFQGEDPDETMVWRCGLCGDERLITRREMPGFHDQHRRERHAA